MTLISLAAQKEIVYFGMSSKLRLIIINLCIHFTNFSRERFQRNSLTDGCVINRPCFGHLYIFNKSIVVKRKMIVMKEG